MCDTPEKSAQSLVAQRFSARKLKITSATVSATPRKYRKVVKKLRKCFFFYENGEMISTFLSGFENMEESEIINAAKNYAIGEPTNKEDRHNLKNVKRQKCKLIAVVEVLGFLGSPILNMIYPGEVSRDVEICLDILVDKYLPMFQDKQKGE